MADGRHITDRSGKAQACAKAATRLAGVTGVSLFANSCGVVAIPLTIACSAMQDRWPVAQALAEPVTIKTKSGSKLTLSRLTVEQGSGICIASARVEDDILRRKSSRLMSVQEADTVQDNRNFARDFVTKEVTKICSPQRIEVADNIGTSPHNSYSPYYLHFKSDGSVVGRPMEICGP